MNKTLLKEYRDYAKTEESYAVLFTKKYLTQAKGNWVDIIDSKLYEMSSDKLHFKFVKGTLYKRKIKPQYPSQAKYTINGKFNEHEYYLALRAITWETAHRDIQQQKSNGVKGVEFKITGVSFNKNRNNKNYFRYDAPPEIKALAEDLTNRTNPLWDKALKYINKPEFIYKIKRIYIKSV